MAQPTFSLLIDVVNRTLVRAINSTVPASLPSVYQGDTLTLSLRFLLATNSPAAPYTDIDYSTASVIVAVGNIGVAPTAGNFTITDTAATQTTGDIAWNASAATVQAAIRAGLTTNWSTAVVTGNAGGPYTIVNGANGAQSALIGTSVSLTPASSVVVGDIQTGTASLPSIQYLQLLQAPIALQDTWTPSATPTATVTRLQAGSGTTNETQQIGIDSSVYSGAFVVNFGGATSAPIAYSATVSTVQSTLSAMSSIGAGNVSVGGSAGAWVVTFTGTLALASHPLMTTISSLVAPLTLTGNLSLNTAAIEEEMANNDSISPTFAIQVTPSGGQPFTVLQTGLTIQNDLIVGAPSIPTPGVSYYTTTQSDARYVLISSLGTGVDTALGKPVNGDNGLIVLDGSGNLSVPGALSSDNGQLTSDGSGNVTAGSFTGNGAGLNYIPITGIEGIDDSNFYPLGGTLNAPGGLVATDNSGNLSISGALASSNFPASVTGLVFRDGDPSTDVTGYLSAVVPTNNAALVTNSTAFTASGLGLTLPVGTWDIDHDALVSATNATAGVQTKYAFTGSLTDRGWVYSVANSGSANFASLPTPARQPVGTFVGTAVASGSALSMSVQGRVQAVVTSAGSLTLQVAQNVATPGQSAGILKGSYLRASRVA